MQDRRFRDVVSLRRLGPEALKPKRKLKLRADSGFGNWAFELDSSFVLRTSDLRVRRALCILRVT
jgi:hypothetical protein